MSYQYVIVESYLPENTSGLHGKVHIRPIEGQGLDTNMHVQCSKELSDIKHFPIGTQFKIKAKITERLGGKPFLYSSYKWAYERL
jgi:hypothetical protein